MTRTIEEALKPCGCRQLGPHTWTLCDAHAEILSQQVYPGTYTPAVEETIKANLTPPGHINEDGPPGARYIGTTLNGTQFKP